ncbi:GyrI-like domain-containing protein [Dehalogenimonas alkenigignens]|uniref:GyrI-like small molecule binding domain-containing protein n=1 Tax=Dehalogenimonas alkenigignens TaxID=1217799 RepID=A0A0W0GI90_9CHLR|nr:GyrI-like domain-containing protein [Dehalogenimonas alkenigignens]KTB48259.1 hypothetical protein DEALK_11040 [Dehalogenimonas alkenigignens]PVV84489.1 hypothetical protein DD509_04135 [Dehalogenimonas alkenigignens]
MEKIDFKKTLKYLFNAPMEPVFVEVPEMNYLMVDGRGRPDSSDAACAIGAVYSVAYTIKFMVKNAGLLDFGVLPLEGLWWSDDMADFTNGNKDDWQWTYMIMQPSLVNRQMVEKAVAEVRRKKNPAAIGRVKFEALAEGRSAQMMHIGPYADEGPNIAKLHRFISETGYAFDGKKRKHHEIYLSDPARTAPEKMKTIIRQPVT